MDFRVGHYSRPYGLRGTRFLGVVALLLLATACGRQAPVEPSCGFVQNTSSQRVSWASRLPVKLFVHQGVPLPFMSAIEEAAQMWNTSSGRELIRVVPGLAGPGSPQPDGVSGLYWMSTWEEAKSDEQARTTIYWSGSEIYEADMRINDKNFDFYASLSFEPRKIHLTSLVVHEMGHVLGLSHTPSVSSVMYPTLANGKVRLEIGDSEKASMKCEYGS